MLDQKTAFQGLSLEEARRGISDLFVTINKNNIISIKLGRGLEINCRTAGASKTVEVEVDKPLGLTLGQKPAGGVVITVRTPHPSNKTSQHFNNHTTVSKF